MSVLVCFSCFHYGPFLRKGVNYSYFGENIYDRETSTFDSNSIHSPKKWINRVITSGCLRLLLRIYWFYFHLVWWILIFKENWKNVKFPLRIVHINYLSPSQGDAVIWNGISRKPKQLFVSLRVCNIWSPRIGNSGCSWCELLEPKRLPKMSGWSSIHVIVRRRVSFNKWYRPLMIKRFCVLLLLLTTLVSVSEFIYFFHKYGSGWSLLGSRRQFRILTYCHKIFPKDTEERDKTLLE
jgi:hypothetical protein